MRTFLAGLTALFRKDRNNQELDEELHNYIEAAAEHKMSNSGMTRAEALHASRLEMGSMASIRQEVRSANWETAVESLSQDIHYGVRQLLRSPGFSTVAILTLALGIGANTAIFTLVHAVLWKPLPIANPQQLYRIGEGDHFCCEWGGLQDSWETFDYPFYKHVRDSNASFEQLAAFSGNTPSFNMRRAGSQAPAETINGEYISGNYFAALGLQPGAGRLLAPEDDRPNGPAAVVIGHRLWQQRFASDTSVVGSTLLINDVPVTVIGVAPPDFNGARLSSAPPELWIPLNQEPALDRQGAKSILYSSGLAWLYVIGRLQPGLTPQAVEPQLSSDLQQWLRAEGRRDDGRHKIDRQHIALVPGGTGISSFRNKSKLGLYLLSAASAFVLLIACANIANLLLARSAWRKQQTALRLSLGATRARLIRAALTESVVLSVIGGAAGLLIAYLGTGAILLLAFRGAAYVPIVASPTLPVLGFALLLSLLTGVIFGVTPAWIGTHAEPSQGLRGSSRSATAHSSRPQRTLVITQTALSIVLLAIAGLVTQSLRNIEKTDLGFETQGRVLAQVGFHAAGYKPEQLPALYAQLQDRLDAIPGVRAASYSLNTPQDLCCINLNIIIGGRTEKWIEDVNVIFSRVSPRYFETIGTPLLRGRAIDRGDTQRSRHIAVVDEAFALKFFPGEDAIGKHFGLSLPGHGFDYEIVGIVKDAKYRTVGLIQHPMFFVPFTQTTEYAPQGYRRLESGTLFAQSIQLSVAGRPEGYENLLRNTLASINPNLSVTKVKSYSEQVAVQYNQERLIARLTGLFSLLALLLASIGLYGVTAYNVARRTSEIGIRMALGASASTVIQMVLKGAFRQVAIGLAIGVPLAILSARYLANQLYGVGSFDPFGLGSATLVLIVCTLVAGIIPARRAAAIAPVEALRIE